MAVSHRIGTGAPASTLEWTDRGVFGGQKKRPAGGRCGRAARDPAEPTGGAGDDDYPCAEYFLIFPATSRNVTSVTYTSSNCAFAFSSSPTISYARPRL